MEPARLASKEARQKIRAGHHSGPTTILAPGHVQTNLVTLPRSLAFDFLLFATRNPKPCPIVEVIETGTEARKTAPGSNIATDIPNYRLFRHGELAEKASKATEWWTPDLVSFILGCSFSFEAALVRNDLPVRHLEEGCNVPMFITNIECASAGDFAGPLVVTMRPMPKRLVETATAISSRYDHAHGAPVHVGSPQEIGISDLQKPDFGDSVTVKPEEVPMFWACGVTPQLAIKAAAPEIAITHEPGHMFITDLSD